MLDALVSVGRLGLEAARLTAERLSPSSPATPATIADLRPDWLTAVLQTRWPGCRVRDCETTAADTGTTARARLRLHFSDAHHANPPPATVFVKLAPPDTATRLFVNLMQLGRTEVGFYRQLADSVGVEVPQVIHASCSGPSQRFALVLEDLVVRGARFTNVSESLSHEDARRVVSALADLHAAFWDSPRFGTDLAWLKARGHNPHYRVERFLCDTALPRGVRKFADLVPAAVQAAVPRLLAARDALEDMWATGPLTLVHGDAHAGNLYLLADRVGFLDWQVTQRCQGMRDVAYFLANSVPTELRRHHEHSLIDLYLGTLADHGVVAPSFDTAWRQYRAHVWYAFIGAGVTAAATTLQTEAIVRAGLARSSAAVIDLESLDLLS